ncbi:MAG: Rne/Rng family ribonuclease [Sphingomicrobium sp.]
MSMRMLIDARHPEETRVAVAKGNRIEEFDFESAEHKQLKGNIYLAKVTRVEPSLQAAFIDYGGNRHGFLAFSEIHPDYYQIPKADRDALLREEAEHAAEEERLRSGDDDDDHYADDDQHDDVPHDVGDSEDGEDGEDGHDRVAATTAAATAATDATTEAGTGSSRSPVDESAADELRTKRQALRRRYKIQDVIQRRQVLLVQVVKEERGNKGAALTTYLSLAGRYCVLMPNTSHGGGISRKIPNGADRKRLKSIMSDLKLPTTMGLIVRTAGLSRTKVEIKRDFDYLARLWDEIRERTLGSTAPALIYRDSDLIKRAIRDLYHREIDEVVVEGEDGYKAARGFMKLLMPSHVRRVTQHSETTPLFQRYGVEDQLSAMYQPVVQLKSGGYLVINPTEALVSIDINSGRSTREHNIEQTAFATNIEAAAEIARQLRLRDMAGLVVIDFIDMEQNNHVRKVEKAMKDALRNDRARIQVGRISSFGLMEMSRQRLRTGVLEASTKPCPHCEGTGLMRTASSAGLSALRIVEDEAARGRGDRILLRAGREAAVYVLNKKRSELADIEARYGVSIEVLIDESFEGARMSVESSGAPPIAAPRAEVARVTDDDDSDMFDEAAEDDAEEEDEESDGDDDDTVEISLEGENRNSGGRKSESREGDDGDGQGRKRRRRRRGGRGRGRREGGHDAEGSHEAATAAPGDQPADGGSDDSRPPAQAESPSDDSGSSEAPTRRRRRRGGRRDIAADAPENRETDSRDNAVAPDSSPMVDRPTDEEPPIAPTAPAQAGAPKARRSRSKKAAGEDLAVPEPAPGPAPADDSLVEDAPAKPARKRRAKASDDQTAPVAKPVAKPAARVATKTAAAPAPARARRAASAKTSGDSAAAVSAADPDSADDSGLDASGEARRGGWWQRTFG